MTGVIAADGPGPGSWRLERSLDLGSSWMPAGQGMYGTDFGIHRLPAFTWPPVEAPGGDAKDQRLLFISIYQDHSSLATWQGPGGEITARFTSSEMDLTSEGQIPLNHGSLEVPANGSLPAVVLFAFVGAADTATAPAGGSLPPGEAFVRTALLAGAAALRDSLFATPPASGTGDLGNAYDSFGQTPSGYYRLSPHRFPDIDNNGIPDYLQVFNHLIITEVCYDNGTGLGFTSPDTRNVHDWVEIHNPTGNTYTLEDFYLSDDPAQPERYQICAEDGELGPGESVVIYCMGDAYDVPPFLRQAPFRLKDAGEAVYIFEYRFQLPPLLIDSFPGPSDPGGIAFPTHPLRGISYGRTGVSGTLANRIFTLPSPGRQTGDPGFASVCAEPEIYDASVPSGQPDTLPGGFLDAPVLAGVRDGVHYDHANGGVLLLDPGTGLPVRDSGSTFVFTLNGAEPTADSDRYTGPIAISRSTVLRVSALRPDGVPSPPVTRTFILPADVLAQTRLPGLPGTGPRWASDPAVVAARHAPGTDTDGIAPPAFAAYDAEPGILAALRAAPSVAITVPWKDVDVMFVGGNSKIDYPASFEWIDPAHPTDYDQENASVQISGEYSAGHNNTKLSLDVIFRKRLSRYGRTRWQGPVTGTAPPESAVFPGSPVPTFDRLLLRNPFRETFTFDPSNIRYFSDSYLKETQRAVGGFNVRRRWVHVYLNSYYWGIYDLGEHVDPDLFRSHILAGSLPRNDLNPNTEKYDDIRVINYGIQPPNRDTVAADRFEAAVVAAERAAADPTSTTKWTALTDLIDIDDCVRFILAYATIGQIDFDSQQWRGWIHPDDNRMRFILWDGDNCQMYTTEHLRVRVDAERTWGTKLHQILHGWNGSTSSPTYASHPSYRSVFWNILTALAASGAPLSQPSLNSRFDGVALEVRHLLSCDAIRWGDSQSIDFWKSNLFGNDGSRTMPTGFPIQSGNLVNKAETQGLKVP